MGNFFYDSLDTLKTVKLPTNAELVKFTIAVLITIVVAGAIFILFDNIAGALYNMLYNLILG